MGDALSEGTIGAMTSPEIRSRGSELLVAVPVGSCEQHGPHLPLWTDSLVAATLCDALAEARSDVAVAPLVGVGASGEHAGFAGTLSVGSPFLAAYLTELVRSSRTWSRGTLFVSGHGGNLDALREVQRTADEEGDDVVTYLPTVPGGDAHAGHTETSLIAAIDDDQVRHNVLVTGNLTPLAELAPALRRDGVAAVSPTGVLGDPTTASALQGRRVLDELVADLLDVVTTRFGAPR
jgi:creatinine amidohydrolase